MTATETGIVWRAPYSVRVNTSRLSASVPKQVVPARRLQSLADGFEGLVRGPPRHA